MSSEIKKIEEYLQIHINNSPLEIMKEKKILLDEYAKFKHTFDRKVYDES